MGWICLNLGRLRRVENTPFEVLRKWERILSDLFSGFRRLDVLIFLWDLVV
jgi:hypothetical protein